MLKIGDMVKAHGHEYGFIIREDSKHFWIFWFDDPDCEKNNYMFKYSKTANYKYIMKVS